MINEQVLKNIFNQAKLALSNDSQTKLYNQMAARQHAFRQLNQKANTRKALFSGMPAAQQLQFDANTTIPSGVKIIADAVEKMNTNQEKWNEFNSYIKDLEAKTNELRSAMK